MEDIDYAVAIRNSGLTIYDSIEIGDPLLWIPTLELEKILDDGLRGFSVTGLALRTRSKVVKQRICNILGYPTPTSFKKTQPRFIGQNFDVYGQKSNNLQVWNEQLSPTRRYVMYRVSEDYILTEVKVVNGDDLALLDTTGKLTQKYQARLELEGGESELISTRDTDNFRLILRSNSRSDFADKSPISYPDRDYLLPISTVYNRLMPLIGADFIDVGSDQERLRGAELHKLVCKSLGYSAYQDDGRFPDVRHQLLEIKLQTASTIDLGLVLPSSTEPLDVPKLAGRQVRHCDVRYAIFYGAVKQDRVRLSNLFVTTGEDFFSRFTQFGGRTLNKKLQIPLPADFFSS